jgi:hypothetical protein
MEASKVVDLAKWQLVFTARFSLLPNSKFAKNSTYPQKGTF